MATTSEGIELKHGGEVWLVDGNDWLLPKANVVEKFIPILYDVKNFTVNGYHLKSRDGKVGKWIPLHPEPGDRPRFIGKTEAEVWEKWRIYLEENLKEQTADLKVLQEYLSKFPSS